MEILSRIEDKRINSWNIFVVITIGDYLNFAEDILENNDMQRKKIKSSKSVYSLLKSDLKRGCVIPPLVLALTDSGVVDENTPDQQILEYVNENPQNLMILDGLQRTYTMIAAKEELEKENNTEELYQFLSCQLRLEIYIGINKFGILYRMLTLNTGQTPMSTRHQIEILYKNLVDTNIDGMKLVTETEGRMKPSVREVKFKDAVEGFNSYMYRDELPIDRQDLLDNVKMLENLSHENTQTDLFREFISSYVQLMEQLEKFADSDNLDFEGYGLNGKPFGNSIVKVFNTSQALTGFGAAAGRLKDYDKLKSFEQLDCLCGQIMPGRKDTNEWFIQFLRGLDKVKSDSKKIGNGQRMLFQYFFRELLNPESDSYLNLYLAAVNCFQKYRSQV
ncbi:MAG: hypothetical protein HFH32_00030 [Eubacterium sp.]|nr:hypothetical protein [Eubacterium sp.]